MIQYGKNYSKTSGSLWNYYKDEPTNYNEINHYLKSKSFYCKSNVADKLGDIDGESKANKESVKVAVP